MYQYLEWPILFNKHQTRQVLILICSSRVLSKLLQGIWALKSSTLNHKVIDLSKQQHKEYTNRRDYLLFQPGKVESPERM